MTAERQAHWDGVFAKKAETELTWFQERPATSLGFIEGRAAPGAPVIDVGGGDGRLVDHLLADGYTDLTVLDLAPAALDRARQRIGPCDEVSWINADVTAWAPPRIYTVWHDRAVFHFLTHAADRRTYKATLARAVPPGGWVVIASFARHGPRKCSGLPVMRYAPETLAAELGSMVRLEGWCFEDHVTPGGTTQAFQYSCFRRV